MCEHEVARECCVDLICSAIQDTGAVRGDVHHVTFLDVQGDDIAGPCIEVGHMGVGGGLVLLVDVQLQVHLTVRLSKSVEHKQVDAVVGGGKGAGGVVVAAADVGEDAVVGDVLVVSGVDDGGQAGGEGHTNEAAGRPCLGIGV